MSLLFLYEDYKKVEEAGRREARQAATAHVHRYVQAWQLKHELRIRPTSRFGPEGTLLDPPPFRQAVPLPLGALTLEQQQGWEAAEADELKGNIAEAIARYEFLHGMQLDRRLRAEVIYRLAVLAWRQNQTEQCLARLASLENDFGKELNGLGVTYATLSLGLRFRLQPKPETLDALSSALLSDSTEVSRPWLQELARQHPTNASLTDSLSQLNAREDARRFWLSVFPPTKQTTGWVQVNSQWDWIAYEQLPDQSHQGFRVSEEMILSLEEKGAPLPAYLVSSWSFDGRVLGQTPRGERWALASQTLAWRGMSVPVTVSLHRGDLSALFRKHRTRSLLTLGLLGASIIAGSVGLITSYRAFQRELQLSEMKTNFVSSVSHELRAPLASVRLMAEGLERGSVSDPARQREYYRFMVQESARLSGLIENVLDVSRIEMGKKRYEMEPASLDALGKATVDGLIPYAQHRKVHLKWVQESAGLNEGVVDARAIQQALVNLIDNAIKHSPENEGVEVRLRRDDQVWEFVVSDQGPGIPATEHARIFEQFYRLGSELRRETQGIGIGLHLVKHVAEAHGGSVIVESAPGQGSRFILRLPLHGQEVGL